MTLGFGRGGCGRIDCLSVLQGGGSELCGDTSSGRVLHSRVDVWQLEKMVVKEQGKPREILQLWTDCSGTGHRLLHMRRAKVGSGSTSSC